MRYLEILTYLIHLNIVYSFYSVGSYKIKLDFIKHCYLEHTSLKSLLIKNQLFINYISLVSEFLVQH